MELGAAFPPADRWGSEVEDGHVEEVAEALRLIQVVDVVVVAGWRRQAEERREHWGGRGEDEQNVKMPPAHVCKQFRGKY